MKIINFDQISNLGIEPKDCVEWVENVFMNKYTCVLPPKVCIKIPQNILFNTMPSYLPDIKKCGVKIGTRYPDHIPSVRAEILLYDSEKGNLLALMDATWITAMRTGAVAALSIKTLKSKNVKEYAFMGLGNTARATLLCLQSIMGKEELNIRLLAYKDQAFSFMERFKDYPNLHFTVYQTPQEVISSADVIVSCVTAADFLFAPDECFKPGVLVVPVHTRGFQNCDLFFDKVFADDKGHVEGFKYFNQFRQFDELSNVLLGNNPGRESDDERILAYNIGISLNDIYYASKIYDKSKQDFDEEEIFTLQDKFWI